MLKFYLKNKEQFILISVGMLFCLFSYVFNNKFIWLMGDFSFRFSDADDFMQLVRLRDFFTHGDLAYSLVYRVNEPFGTDIFWSRLYDFILIVPIWLLNFILKSVVDSIEYVCFVISPIMKSFCVIVVYHFFQKIMTKGDAFFGAILFAMLPFFAEISSFGKASSHMFIMTLEILFLSFLANVINSGFLNKTDHIKLAIASVLCIWASVETLLLILIVEVSIFCFLKNDVKKIELLYLKAVMMLCLITLITLFPMNLASFCCRHYLHTIAAVSSIASLMFIVISNKKISAWHFCPILFLIFTFSINSSFSYDKISELHVVLYACLSLYLLCAVFVIKYCSERYIMWSLAFLILIIGGAFLYTYPKFLFGIYGAASEFLFSEWCLKLVDFATPMQFKYTSLFFLSYGLILFVSMYDVAYQLTNKKHKHIDMFWWILLVINMIYFLLAGSYLYMLSFSVAFSLPLIVRFGVHGLAEKYISRSFCILATTIIVMVPSLFLKCGNFLSGMLDFSDDRYVKQYLFVQSHHLQEKKVYKFLDDISDAPVVIMSTPNLGPKILYYTKHNVVAVPFHNHEMGIASSMVITSKNRTTEEETKSALLSTKSSYVFIDNVNHTYVRALNLANVLRFERMPDWIQMVDITTAHNADYTLAKICMDKM